MRPCLFLLFTLPSLLHAQPLDLLWQREGAGDSSRYGYQILPLGDQNDDGYADWAVFAKGGIGDRPLVECFHGGNPSAATPYLTLHDVPGVFELRDASGAGDVNGDGYPDLLELRHDPADPWPHFQVALFLLGPAADILPDLFFSQNDSYHFKSIGDFNGDGYDDLYRYHWPPADWGEVFYGGAPMDTLPDWTRHSPEGSAYQTLPVAFGDLNGDGDSDWCSVRPTTNTAWIFLGGANPDTVPTYTWPNMAHWPLAIVRDLNGDGYDDLAYYNREIYLGGLTMQPVPVAVLNFPCTEQVPTFASSAGDINGDGYHDLVLLREYCSNSWWGVFSLYLGHPWLNPAPAITIEGWTNPLNLIGIWTAAGLGDVNGDGIDDLAIGAHDDVAYLGWRGKCVVLAGDTDLVAPADDPRILPPSSFSLSAFPNPFNATTRIRYTLPREQAVTLAVFDLLGREVAVLHRGPARAGEHTVAFDARALPSGLYLLRLQGAEMALTRKMVLLK